MRARQSGCARAAVNERRKERLLCRGFSNATLLVAIGLIALITFLAQIQTGALDLGALIPAKAAAQAGAKGAGAGKQGKPPAMITFPVNPLDAAAERFVKERRQAIAEDLSTKRDVALSLAHMDEAAAAKLLQAMDQAAAVELLSQLEERDLARIFAAAPPDIAAQWVSVLMAPRQLPEIPEPFKPAAKRAGLYDDTQELLKQYATGVAGTAPPGGSTAAPPSPGAAGNAAQPGAAPAPGAAPSAGAGSQPGGTPPANPQMSPASLRHRRIGATVEPPQSGKGAADGSAAPWRRKRPPPPGNLAA
jgi:hypothetical protein